MTSDPALPHAHPISLSLPEPRREIAVAYRPDAAARAAIAEALGALGVAKLRLDGTLRPRRKRDWLLDAQLGATVTQACVVSLAPVTTRIDVPLTRRYMADPPAVEGPEAEMPEDETIEPLPREIDIGEVVIEALALELPIYPRAADAELGQAIFSPEGTEPLTDEAMRPLAGLAELKKKLDK